MPCSPHSAPFRTAIRARRIALAAIGPADLMQMPSLLLEKASNLGRSDVERAAELVPPGIVKDTPIVPLENGFIGSVHGVASLRCLLSR